MEFVQKSSFRIYETHKMYTQYRCPVTYRVDTAVTNCRLYRAVKLNYYASLQKKNNALHGRGAQQSVRNSVSAPKPTDRSLLPISVRQFKFVLSRTKKTDTLQEDGQVFQRSKRETLSMHVSARKSVSNKRFKEKKKHVNYFVPNSVSPLKK